MDTKITVEEFDNHLAFHIAGPDTIEVSLSYFPKVADMCKQKGFKKALIIEELEGDISAADMFTLTEQLPAILRGLKVAFIDLKPNHAKENRFGETVARNRGCNIRVFKDVNEAKTWLTESN